MSSTRIPDIECSIAVSEKLVYSVVKDEISGKQMEIKVHISFKTYI